MSTTTDIPMLPLVPSGEEQAIGEAVRAICARHQGDYARGERKPAELWEALSAAGYVGVAVPEEWGGGGLGMQSLAVVVEEVAAAMGFLPVMLVVSAAITGPILARHGSDAQKQRWLRGIASGTTKVAFAITEPDAGSNSHELRSALRREGDGYLLRGQKTFISGVDEADLILVVARMQGADRKLGAPTLCLIDADAPGLTRDQIPMAYIGPERQFQLFFDDVTVAPERLIGGEGGGLGPIFDGLNPERIAGAAMCCGLGRRALECASSYARERAVWGVPIGTHQGVAHPLAEAKIGIDLARLMMQKAAALYDAGVAAGEAANVAKFAAAEAAIRCVDQAIQTHGGNGLALEYGLTDMWWGTRLARIAPVSREMVLNHVAQHALGLPRSY